MKVNTVNHRRFISLFFVLLLLLGMAGSQSVVPTTIAQSFIVQGQNTAAAARLVEQHGGTVTSHLHLINGVGAKLTEASKAALLAEPLITAVTPNAVVQQAGEVPPTDYPDVIGADLSWGEGAKGSGITVAIVDTGLGWHPGLFKNLQGKVTNRIIGWKDFVDGSRLPRDPNGHGTHIAGIIANTQTGTDGEWNGVAPGVRLVGVRVLDEQGMGTYETVIQGVQWVVQNKDLLKIRVLNLSLVAQVQSPYWADPLNQAVSTAWAHGIVTVVAAGNGGPGPMSIGVPGNNPYVITAGAFTDNYTPTDWQDDYLAPFSASGPTLDGFVKPDLVAPGAHMVSTMLPNSYIAREHRANRSGGMYFSMAGTSQAAAVTSGAAALVLSKHPQLTPDQVKFRLMYTALPWVNEDGSDANYSIWQMGAGRLNAYDAVMGEMDGRANLGMDIQADLAGTTHYEGYSYYDEATHSYRLRGDASSLPAAFGVWSGGYEARTGAFGVWSGGWGVWSGALGVWSGGWGVWSGAFGVWSGGWGVWSGGWGVWSGAFGVWSGGYDQWSGQEPWAGTEFGQATFVEKFLSGESPSADTDLSIGQWVEEPSASH